MKIKITEAKCKKCGHRWVARTLIPKACPGCKSYQWMGKKK